MKTEKDYLLLDGSNYNQTAYTYDAFGRTTDTKVTKPDGSLVSEQKHDYTQASRMDGITGAYNATMVHTLTNASDSDKGYKAVAYTDALGRTAYTQNYNVGSYFTDSAVYSSFNNLTQISGATVNTQTYATDLTKNQQTTNTGNVLNQNGSTGDPINYIKNYNGFGLQVISTDANGSSAIVKYDALGRAVETYTPFDKDSAGNVIYTKKKTYYDAAGRTVEVKQQNNKIGDAESYSDTRNTYDSMGNLVAVERVNGTQGSEFTQYYYDGKGRVLRAYTGLTAPLIINGLANVTPNGDNDYEITKYAYDFYGNIRSYTDGNGNSETYQYNELTGQLTEKDLRNSSKITYTYDNAGNTTQVSGSQSGSTLTNTYTYDLAGNLLESKNGSCDTTYTYDDMGRVTKETDVYTGGSTFVKGYTYDGKNVQTYTLTKDGTVQVNEGYSYEGNGRLREIDYGNVIQQHYSYDANGNVRLKGAVTNVNGKSYDSSTETTYNIANLPINTFDGVLDLTNIAGGGSLIDSSNTDYHYSLDSNLISVFNRITGATLNTYSYDGLGRLTNETVTNNIRLSNSFTYDDYGNRISMAHTDEANTANNFQTAYTYDKANRLQTQTVNGSGTSTNYRYSYDAAGNLLQKQSQASGGSWTTDESFTYDALNETASAAKGGTSTSFKYNANGQRISKNSGGATTQSVWNGGSISADYATSGGTTGYNQYLADNAGVIQNGSTIYANMLDAQGDCIDTFNASAGTTCSTYQYDANGNHIYGSAETSPLNYRNQYYDSETGLYYLNSRYYDPTTGTFTQEDTFWGDIKSPATLNLYGYCNDNPVMSSDPTGHWSQGELLRRGSYGSDVSALQSRLNANGASLDVDGCFGPLTRAAVVAYQASHDLEVDGIVGNQMWGALFGSSSSSSGSSYPGSYVERGQSGSSVAAVQQQLNANGASLTVDGIFGPQTQAAVESYQNSHGLGIDGIVGPATWGALFAATSSDNGSSGGLTLSFEMMVAGINIATVGNTQYYDFTVPINKMVRRNEFYLQTHRGTINEGMFMDLVGNNRAWDIKRRSQWGKQIGNFYSGSATSPFVFNGAVITPEILGNKTYGYWGKVLEFSSTELFIGGGAAQISSDRKISIYEATLIAAQMGLLGYYGDQRDDHMAIQSGIDWYNNTH